MLASHERFLTYGCVMKHESYEKAVCFSKKNQLSEYQSFLMMTRVNMRKPVYNLKYYKSKRDGNYQETT